MSLDLTKLQNVREQGGKTIARCPACAENGMDETGEHLVIQADGRFGCVVHPGPAGKPHRQRIAKLVGLRLCSVPTIKVRAPAPAPAHGEPVRICDEARVLPPAPTPARSVRNEPELEPLVCALDCGHPRFREPQNGELIVGLYREHDALVAALLYADPHVDLFWDVILQRHVKPPGLYIRLADSTPAHLIPDSGG